MGLVSCMLRAGGFSVVGIESLVLVSNRPGGLFLSRYVHVLLCQGD